ncbi:MAG: hypothetical protein ACKOHI_11655, partial [Phycisphaerales bacterium]
IRLGRALQDRHRTAAGLDGLVHLALVAARMAMGRALVAAKRWREAEAPLLAAWAALEPLDIDARRRSAALLAVSQMYRDWAAADAGGVSADVLESWRAKVRAFDAANPGVIPEGAY